MFSLRGLITVLVILNGIAIIVMIASNRNEISNIAELEENIESHFFLNSETALPALNLLDKFIDIPVEHYNMVKPSRKNFDRTALGLKRDPEYCDKAREHIVNHPEAIFEEYAFISDMEHESMVRAKIIPSVGKDMMPDLTSVMPQEQKTIPKTLLNPKANIYLFNDMIHLKHEMTREIGCTFQAFNHVPGVGSLCRKDLIARSANNYTDRYKDKPQCFDGKKFFPKTLALENETECLQWFNYIHSEEYQKEKEEKKIVFIRKIGIGMHQGAGVQPVDNEEEKSLRDEYKEGELCGKIHKSRLVQYYIHNPLLVMGHKFDFRLYMLIASSNPLIVYYHDGFLRVSLFEYDVDSKEKGMHLTNTAQSLKVIEKAVELGMNETELRNFQMWNLTRFVDYLVKNNIVKSSAWLDEYLRPSFQHAMQHIVRMTQHTYYPISSSWELFGMDFMLDSDLNLWFIEANSGPVLEGSNKEKEILVTKIVKDMYEIVMSFLRSRFKRAIRYVNWLEKSGLIEIDKDAKVKIPKLQQRQQEFADIIKNYFDEEFQPSPDNGWVKIVDESEDGLSRYNGMFATECFDI